MALAAVVGGAFLNSTVDLLIQKLASPEVLSFFKRRKLGDRLPKDLKAIMRSVNKLLNDAEEKQITNSDVKDWLDELKDAVYDAEDLLEEIAYEAQKVKLEAGPQTSTDQVRNLFSSLFNKGKEEMVAKLEDIFQILEHLVRQKDDLGLREGIGEIPSSQKLPTTSLPDDTGVYGRDDDKQAIMEFLLSDDTNGNELGVISIVAMGGMGKTTLARLVYNDDRVEEWFDLRVWVYVSEEFDVLKVTKDVLKELGSTSCNTMTPNQVHSELQEKLKGKKFFLVFDDVWSDDDAQWDFLLAPFKYGAEGSKIIVTTRNESVASSSQRVASVILTSSTYRLGALTDDSCWLLFAKRAFKNEDPSAHPHLEKIGRQIVRKCQGIPLAAKTLGSLLCTDRDAEEWEKILKSSTRELSNDKILPALRLSYYYLPSHLKRCFAYCAIFPKGYEFEKDELANLWMAEGFVVQHKGYKMIKEIGEKYFDDLVSRSFFQRSSAGSSFFIMHDLINDLAQNVAGEFCFKLEEDDLHHRNEEFDRERKTKVPKRTRYLSHPISRSGDIGKMFEGIHEVQPLRTFLSFLVRWYGHFYDKELHELLQIFKRLRVLSLPRALDGEVKLPASIGNLKHLRYLNLSRTGIERLPETVSALYNLQTLILHGCWCLIQLPTNISTLVNLQNLDIVGTKLKEMPSQMGKLVLLRLLTDFYLGKQSGSSVNELGKLKHLRKKLRIHNLQNVVDVQEALEADLKSKKHLKELELRWDGDTNDSHREKMMLEYLEPHMEVEIIVIVGYGGTSFPDWVGRSSFSNMVSLKLDGCKYCTSLPALGQLAALKYLTIIELEAVETVGHEFYGSETFTMKPFQSLKVLRFGNMPQWREWISDAVGSFSFLEELEICYCPKLTNSLPGNLPSLTKVHTWGCSQLLISLPRAPKLASMRVEESAGTLLKVEESSPGMHRLEVWGSFRLIKELEQLTGLSTSLEEIEISYLSLECFHLELFPNLRSLKIKHAALKSLYALEGPALSFTSLNCLLIEWCGNLENFPRGLPAPNLTQLALRGCDKLKSLPEDMQSFLPSLADLVLDNCPELESFPKGGLPSKLQSLEIKHCNKLISGRMKWDLRKLPSLSDFCLGDCPDVVEFPEETLLPSTLTSLKIKNLENLKSLNYKGLQHLTSLKELILERCIRLESIPEGGLPSLSNLEIKNCDLLLERCRWDGVDWSKISHIPNIQYSSVRWR